MQQPASDQASAAQQIQTLRDQINHHNWCYHTKDAPEISDIEFDQMFKKLIELEQQFPHLIVAESPSQRIGSKPLEGFEKFEHQVPMLSLSNVFDDNELLAFHERILKLSGQKDIRYQAEPKYDGLAISLIYESGRLVAAATRGDGQIGELVTENIKTIATVPLVLKKDDVPDYFVVKGEVILSKKGFEKVNEQRKKEGRKQFDNARNGAAGSVRVLDPKETRRRPLEVYVYGAHFGQNAPATLCEQLAYLSACGFKTSDMIKSNATIAEIIAHFKHLEQNRANLAYEIDGMVIKVDTVFLHEQLGYTSRTPRWATAYKFKAEQAETTLFNIEVQVGRMGAITPVAKLAPVRVGGVTVTSATLHNEDEIKRLDLKIGDTVVIERAGDVIPAIKMARKELRTGKETDFSMPVLCPSCNQRLVRTEGEAVVFCTNTEACPAQFVGNLENLVGKDAFNMDGLGEKLVFQLFAAGLVKRYPDLFKLSQADFMGLERMGKKSATNAFNAIEKAKKVRFDKFIYALGVKHIGRSVSRLLSENFDSIEALYTVRPEEYLKIEGIGDTIAQAAAACFTNPAKQQLIRDMLDAGVQIIYEKQSVGTKASAVSGKTFVLTGTFANMSREQAKALIENAGGKVSSAVSGKTTFVVAGNSPGSKVSKATALGVPIITDADLEAML